MSSANYETLICNPIDSAKFTVYTLISRIHLLMQGRHVFVMVHLFFHYILFVWYKLKESYTHSVQSWLGYQWRSSYYKYWNLYELCAFVKVQVCGDYILVIGK